MIAEDFAGVRVLATESIAAPMVEGARTRTRVDHSRQLTRLSQSIRLQRQRAVASIQRPQVRVAEHQPFLADLGEVHLHPCAFAATFAI